MKSSDPVTVADRPKGPLRRGWTTGACATAALKSALAALDGRGFEDPVTITLPRGETPAFALAHRARGPIWAEAGVIKDAGDDPDVTHGCLVIVRVEPGPPDSGLVFEAGEGVGVVTKPGLPLPPGEPAINPAPRAMMRAVAGPRDLIVTISIPGGAKIAERTWNGRLGIIGGLSVLGTTGVVRPFSCSAWIASIQRGIDVARASGLTHVAGATGATSEAAARAHLGLGEEAMIDMGDFAGGMLKYLRRHPVERVTLAGGLGKLIKLAQGALDLHSARSQIDFGVLAGWMGDPRLARAETALEALQLAGPSLAAEIAGRAREAAQCLLGSSGRAGMLVVSRSGEILAEAP